MVIEKQAKLIESLAGTINEKDWASDILNKCSLIREAVLIIEKEARKRESSEL